MTTREAFHRIIIEAGPLAANCPPAPHGCPYCEILHVATQALKDLRPIHPDGCPCADCIWESEAATAQP